MHPSSVFARQPLLFQSVGYYTIVRSRAVFLIKSYSIRSICRRDSWRQSAKSANMTVKSPLVFPSARTTTIRNPHLRLLNALQADERPIMTFFGLPSFRTAQIVAQTGLDVRIPFVVSMSALTIDRVSSLIVNTATSPTMRCITQSER
jgi:hypothetical protein